MTHAGLENVAKCKETLVCHWCKKPIEGADGAMEICGVYRKDGKDRLVYPYPPHGSEIVIMTHYGCGDGQEGYWFALDRLDEDWEDHLSGKAWWFGGIGQALAKARAALGIVCEPWTGSRPSGA